MYKVPRSGVVQCAAITQTNISTYLIFINSVRINSYHPHKQRRNGFCVCKNCTSAIERRRQRLLLQHYFTQKNKSNQMRMARTCNAVAKTIRYHLCIYWAASAAAAAAIVEAKICICIVCVCVVQLLHSFVFAVWRMMQTWDCWVWVWVCAHADMQTAGSYFFLLLFL